MLVGGVVANDDDIIAAPQMIEAMLHQAKHCAHPELMNPHLGTIVSLLLRALANPEVQKRPVLVRMWLITAIMDAFYFDAQATMQILADSGAYPHFFYGYFEFFSGVVSGSSSAAAKKSKKNRTESAEVIRELTILFRKVNILGLTSMLMVVTPPDSPYAGSFDPSFVAGAVRMINFCIEENYKTYGPRCKNLEESIQMVQSGFEEEKEEDFDEEDMDLEEDQEDLVNADNNEGDDEEDEDEDGIAPESTDDYYTPIDKICEVEFYAQWLRPARSLMGNGASAPNWAAGASAVMLGDSELGQARDTSGKYIQLIAELERVREDDHTRRAQAAVLPVQ
jgi:importin-7